MHGNDLTKWGDGGDNSHAMATRPHAGMNVTDPNQFTEWEAPGAPKDKTPRPVDVAIKNAAIFTCEKCSLKTMSRIVFVTHTKKDEAGLVQCERERKKAAEAGPVDLTSLKKELTEAVASSIKEGFAALVAALKPAVPVEAPKKAKRPYHKKDKTSVRDSSVVQGRLGKGGSGVVGTVESEAQPMADPSPGPEES